MASNTTKVQGFLDQQQHAVPPPSCRESVERYVMSRLTESRGRRKGNHARFLSITLAIIIASTIGIMLLRNDEMSRRSHPNASYVESVIILDDHVCIWLEPINPPTKENPSHE
jgi:hypothetical protein